MISNIWTTIIKYISYLQNASLGYITTEFKFNFVCFCNKHAFYYCCYVWCLHTHTQTHNTYIPGRYGTFNTYIVGRCILILFEEVSHKKGKEERKKKKRCRLLECCHRRKTCLEMINRRRIDNWEFHIWKKVEKWNAFVLQIQLGIHVTFFLYDIHFKYISNDFKKRHVIRSLSAIH